MNEASLSAAQLSASHGPVAPGIRMGRDIRIREPRPKRSRMQRRDVRWLIGISLFLHLLALALFLLLGRHAVVVPPKEEPSFGMVFEPAKEKVQGGKQPTKVTSTPKGEPAKEMQATPKPASPPPPPAEKAPPEVNPFPPEFMEPQEPPPPPQQDAEARPTSPPHPHPQQHRQARASQSNNPFAHMQEYSFAPPSRPSRSAGLRNSRSLDLAEGPVISGGQLHDAVTHVIGPSGPEDYMAMLSEYIETHKYYPESAAAAGEQGVAAVRVTIERDGSVSGLSLAESSGSRTLDIAWEAVFRDGKLPAFTDDMKEQRLTLTLSLDYILTFRSR